MMIIQLILFMFVKFSIRTEAPGMIFTECIVLRNGMNEKRASLTIFGMPVYAGAVDYSGMFPCFFAMTSFAVFPARILKLSATFSRVSSGLITAEM